MRNPFAVPSDYPFEAPVWNLSPIMFQAGPFTIRRRGQLQTRRTGSTRFGSGAVVAEG